MQPPRTPTSHHWRKRAGLSALKVGHEFVFVVELASILWLVYTGIVGRRDRTVAVAGVLVGVEAAAVAANRGVCPLTALARDHGDGNASVSGIFLPDAIARTTLIWSSTLLAIAAVLHVRSARRADRVHRRG